MSKSELTRTDLPEAYCGRILAGNYSEKIKETVLEQVAACSAFDRIGLGAMSYIAAWHLGQPGIWYEFVSQRFLDLFGVEADRLTREFSSAILDRREYKRADICPDIREMTLQRRELDEQRLRIREESIKTGETEAVYKVQLPDNQERWYKDQA
ncbi:MAG: hypothetical protein ACWGN1_02910, partial [Desulfobulbales bacterium]